MNNSKRSIIFFISFMSVVILLTVIAPYLPLDTSNNLFYGLVLIVFPGLQMLLRYRMTAKNAYKENIFFTVSMAGISIYNRLVYYILLGFLFFIPGLTMHNSNSISIPVVVSLIVWLIIVELMMYITKRYTKVHFAKEGILVRGIDLSIDLPLGNELNTHSGFYYYNQFCEYELLDNKLTLYLTGDRGKVICIIPSDILEPVIAFLNAKYIAPIKRY